jgi:hypothetical protein
MVLSCALMMVHEIGSLALLKTLLKLISYIYIDRGEQNNGNIKKLKNRICVDYIDSA